MAQDVLVQSCRVDLSPTVSRLSRNIVANYLGNGWGALMSFAFVPVYVHYLGIESYGLIGFFVSLQVLLGLLDLGLGAAANREVARLSASPGSAEHLRYLLRTLEWLYWMLAVLIAIGVWLAAHFIAATWLRPANLSLAEIERALVLFGLAFAARWPFALYTGVMMGMQRQVLFNGLRILVETMRGAGSAAVLWLISASLDAFLVWNVFVALLGSLAGAWGAWRCMPRSPVRPGFALALLRRIWKYAAGLTGIAVTAVILLQVDKLAISRMLPLEDFGYYALAWAVASGLLQFVIPVNAAFFPPLSQSVAAGRGEELVALYRAGNQTVALLLVPLGMLLAVLPSEVLQLWTQNVLIAERAGPLLGLLAGGTMLHGLVILPYSLQLAYGWVRLAFWVNVAAIGLLVPLVIILVATIGALGGALVWLTLNVAYIFVSIQIMHTRLLPSEKWPWYRQVLFKPVAVVGSVTAVGKWAAMHVVSDIGLLLILGTTLGTSILACALTLPYIRPKLVGLIRTPLRT